MRNALYRFILFARRYAQAIVKDEIGVRSASLAYFGVFSVFPLALLVVSAIGFLLQDPERQAQALEVLQDLVPASAEVIFDVVEDTITSVIDARGISGLIAIIGLLWAASGLFRALEYSVSTIFSDGEERRPVWSSRGIGLVMALLVTPLLFLGIAMTTLTSMIVSQIRIPEIFQDLVNLGVNQGIMIILTTLALFLIFKLVPRKRIPARWAAIGALLSATGWLIITDLFNWYLQSGFANYNVIYGSIGAIVAMLLYFYLLSFSMLLGAELSAQLARSKDTQPLPLPDAIQSIIEIEDEEGDTSPD